MTTTYPPIAPPRSGDLCRFVECKGYSHKVVEHYRCDAHRDGVVTDPSTNKVLHIPADYTPKGFVR